MTIAIVGAGPAALASAVALRCHGHDDLVVLDPSGAWLSAWHRRFRAQDIPHLRSPSVHHPHPEPFELLARVGPDDTVRSNQVRLPTTTAFARFCDELIDEAALGPVLRAIAVTRLEPVAQGTVLHTADGDTLHAERVVVATNHRRAVLPPAVAAVHGFPGVDHTEHATVADTPAGGTVVVVGGGLSAAHLALGAARRGAVVHLVARRRLTLRRFDTHPTWLGPRKLRPFEAEPDPEVRRRTIDQARGGGSVPHAIHRQLLEQMERGRVSLHERREITRAEPTADDRLRLMLDDGTWVPADRIWCATGGRVDVTSDPLLGPLLDRYPTSVAGGLPVLDDDLRWPGTDVHLSGFTTALTLGPTAGNLIGHRRAAIRLLASLRDEDAARADRVATGPGTCPAGRHHSSHRPDGADRRRTAATQRPDDVVRRRGDHDRARTRQTAARP